MLNEILGPAARFQQLLSRKFGILGGAPSPQLTPEITPEFSIGDRPEDRILCAELYACGRISEAAAAGQPTHIALWNRPNSNQLLVVEDISFYHSSAGTLILFGGIAYSLTQPFPDLPAANCIGCRETRLARDIGGSYTRAPSGVMCAANNAAGGVTAQFLYRASAQYALNQYTQPILLAPGWYASIRSNDVNIAMSAVFSWREVPLASGEIGPF